jgi:hypothetical protein
MQDAVDKLNTLEDARKHAMTFLPLTAGLNINWQRKFERFAAFKTS